MIAGGLRSTPRLVSVILPARDASRILPRQLESLAAQTYEGAWEIVVVDNGSTDGTAGVARSFRERLPQLRVVDASQRKGLNYARNAGAAAARGDFLAYCDADDEGAPGWLSAVTDAAQHYDIVGGRIDDVALNPGPNRSWRLSPTTDQLPVVLGFLPYAVGANLGIWRDVLLELGGWNEAYAGGGDEVELCWRAQLGEYRLGYAPSAVMHYRYRPGLGALFRQMYRYGKAQPQLYQDFRSAGVPHRGVMEGLRHWGWVALHVPDLLGPADRRGVWVRRASLYLGNLRGSLQFRVICL